MIGTILQEPSLSLLQHNLTVLCLDREFTLKGLIATVLYKLCIYSHILKYLTYETDVRCVAIL